MPDTAADLIQYQPYTPLGATTSSMTRKATSEQSFNVHKLEGYGEWLLRLVTLRSNVEYHIKFDKNFVKKHLFTKSKRAIPTSDQAKRENLLKNRRAQGKIRGPNTQLTTWTQTDYENQRTGKGKPTTNPLAGAATSKNTMIVMNEISLTSFKDTIARAIEACGNWQDGTEKELSLDFKKKGTVVNGKIFAGVYSEDPPLQGVVVTVKKEIATDTQKPCYTVVHMDGNKAF